MVIRSKTRAAMEEAIAGRVDHLAVDGAVDIRSGLHRFHHGAGLSGGKPATRLRHLHEYQIAERGLGLPRDRAADAGK